MRTLQQALLVPLLSLPLAGCANLIREEPAVIWDQVDGTASLRLDDLDYQGALVSARLRYFCERRQYDVVQLFETPYRASHELYEVPVGIPGTVLGLVWYILAEGVTLGAADDAVSTAVLDWGAAGLNPFLPVENGMFADYEIVRIKSGSRRPLTALGQEPYDAVVPVEGGRVKVRFAEPQAKPGPEIEMPAMHDTRFELNLLAAAPAIPSPRAQKVLVEASVRWSPQAEPAEVGFEFFIEGELSARLHQARAHARQLLSSDPTADRQGAFEALGQLGFSREAAMLLDQQPGRLNR